MLNNKGQTLLEVIVALSIGVLVVSALVFATIFSLRNASFAKNSAIATKLAQEGIEKIKTARDTNQCIVNLGSVQSWNGNSQYSSCEGNGSIWDFQLSGEDAPPSGGGFHAVAVSDFCENLALGSQCSFKFINNGLSFISGDNIEFPLDFEEITSGSTTFQRVVILSDDLNANGQIDKTGAPIENYQTAKRVTVIVRWTDFSGFHESKLSTILRKL